MDILDLTEAISLGPTNFQRRGFSFLEALVAIAVISVIGGVVIPSVLAEYQEAHLETCIAQLETMQAVAKNLCDGASIPTPDEFWGKGFPDAEEGEYYYIVDDQDANKGHGDDLDGCDEDNPGNSPRCPGMDIKFVVFCAHDHGNGVKYCYATDDLPPTTILVGEEDPFNFKAQKDQGQGNDPKPEGKKPKRPKK